MWLHGATSPCLSCLLRQTGRRAEEEDEEAKRDEEYGGAAPDHGGHSSISAALPLRVAVSARWEGTQ